MAVSRKAMTEGLSEWASSDPLSPSVRTGAAPLGQQGEPLLSALGQQGEPLLSALNQQGEPLGLTGQTTWKM